LEELTLSMDFSKTSEGDEFSLSGMRVEGAEMIKGSLVISKATSSKLESCVIRWGKRVSAKESPEMVNVPVYLNSDRTDVLFVGSIAAGTSSISPDALVQRGIAFVAF
jgi:dynein heavy chain 1